jgi:hypothetical protein
MWRKWLTVAILFVIPQFLCADTILIDFLSFVDRRMNGFDLPPQIRGFAASVSSAGLLTPFASNAQSVMLSWGLQSWIIRNARRTNLFRWRRSFESCSDVLLSERRMQGVYCQQ